VSDVSWGSDGRQCTRPAGQSVLWFHSRHQHRRQGSQHPSDRTSLFPPPGEFRPSYPGHIPSQQLQEEGQTGWYKQLTLLTHTHRIRSADIRVQSLDSNVRRAINGIILGLYFANFMIMDPCIIVQFIEKKTQQDATIYQNFIIP